MSTRCKRKETIPSKEFAGSGTSVMQTEAPWRQIPLFWDLPACNTRLFQPSRRRVDVPWSCNAALVSMSGSYEDDKMLMCEQHFVVFLLG